MMYKQNMIFFKMLMSEIMSYKIDKIIVNSSYYNYTFFAIKKTLV